MNREAFWRIARTWLERGWWNEVRAIGPYVPGVARGRR